MASTLNDARAIRTLTPAEQADVSEGMRCARYRMLEELPGLILGIMTIIYIVTSLARLA
jgi:hypothetical protein